jgi:hypothetical protein
MTESRILRAKLELLRGPLDEAFDSLWAEEPRRATTTFLIALYQVIRASVPLMEAARARARELAPADPVSAALAHYLDSHIEEERHHDEWTLDDLTVAGISRVDAQSRPAPPEVAAAVGAQYYWALHQHPVALLGYLATLEGNPPTVAFIDSLAARSGLPEQAFRTWRKHAELDPHHQTELDRLLDTMPLGEAHRALIGLSMAHTLSSLARLVRAIAASVKSAY